MARYDELLGETRHEQTGERLIERVELIAMLGKQARGGSDC